MARPRRNEDPDELSCSAIHEAEHIFGLVVRGVTTLEGARALIDVPAPTLCLLNEFAATSPFAQRLVATSVTYRADTLRAFNQLVRDHGLEETWRTVH